MLSCEMVAGTTLDSAMLDSASGSFAAGTV
jgi:hypothetical protein